MTKLIEDNGTTYAKIIKSDCINPSDEFLTSANDEIQLGFINRKKDYKTGAHYHSHITQKANKIDEILMLKNGSARVDFYNDKGIYLKSSILNQGDIVIIYKGGHNVAYLEDTDLFIIKPNPYNPETDKTRIIGANNLDLVIDKD